MPLYISCKASLIILIKIIAEKLKNISILLYINQTQIINMNMMVTVGKYK